jgi:hypothetical protein
VVYGLPSGPINSDGVNSYLYYGGHSPLRSVFGYRGNITQKVKLYQCCRIFVLMGTVQQETVAFHFGIGTG